MTVLTERAGAPPAPMEPTFRPDIQGLRAIAVVVVILGHLFDWPAGGFVGVDVFFVISGYLITGLMLREYRSTGSVCISKFYRRRVRRIIPVSTLVLIATVATSYLVYFTARFDTVRDDAIWSFFFLSNWHLAAVGTDYLQADGPVSPLQHYWSLAVEEQFYVVWPLMLLLLLGAFVRPSGGSNSRPLRWVGIAVMSTMLLSLAWSMWETANSPVWAYFSTLSRTWEIAVGAAIAIFAPQLAQLPRAIRPLIFWAGLAGILAAVLLIGPDSAFPGPWAVLPVAAAAMIIVAGLGGAPRFSEILSNPVSGYVGNISYSLYLIHFPVIVLLPAVMPAAGAKYYLIAIIFVVVLSVASFHLVEDPVRRSRWLLANDGSRRQSGHRSSAQRRNRRHVALRAGAASFAVVAVGTLVVMSFQTEQVVVAAMPAATPPAITASATASPATTALETGERIAPPSAVRPSATWAALDEVTLAQQIDAALVARDWPVTTPSIDDASSGRAVEMNSNQRCMNETTFSDPSVCTSFGSNPSLSAIVVGDSVAIHWLAGVRAVLGAQGYSVRGIGLQSCPFSLVEVVIRDNPAASQACTDGRPLIAEQIRAQNPDLVIISDAEASVRRMASGSRGEQALQEWQNGMVVAINAIRSSTTRVVILAPNPAGLSPAECATRTSVPASCESRISDEYLLKSAAESAAATEAGAEYVDVRSWFCNSQGRCPAFVSDNLVRYDSTHLTLHYANHLLPMLDAALSGH